MAKRKRERNARRPSAAVDARPATDGPALRPAAAVALFAAFVGLGLAIYAPALDGDFISDDGHYVQQNPYVHELSLENVAAILDPTSVVTKLVENYAPVHVLLHALEWQVFGEGVFGYHVVNVVVHALASVLLAIAFSRTGIPPLAAALAGGIFFVHPANVEAVAWISQLKTTSAMVLSLGVLLVSARRPVLAAVLFGLALCAKPTAAVVLPMGVALAWMRSRRTGLPIPRRELAGFGAWVVLLAAFAVVEFAAFAGSAGQAAPLYPDLGVRLRSTVALALRYIVMAATGRGLSAFHEPPPATSLLDPWWLAALVVLGLLAWRAVVVLRAGQPEAAWWLWAVVSFAPVCGVIPLPYPMADRYMYFLLPGLIGGTCLMGLAAARRFGAAGTHSDEAAAKRRQQLQIGATAAALLAGWGLATQAHARAYVWRSAGLLMADAEDHYPEGTAAKTRQATRAARQGDAETAVAALRAAYARGYNRLDHLLQEPAYAVLRGDPDFEALLREMAVEWRDRLGASPSPSQIELRALAQAYIVLEDYEAALAALRRALATEGPVTETIEHDVRELERAMRFQRLERERDAARGR